MLKDNNGYTSQFIENCDADWNLNSEFIHWLNYWFKEFKEKAKINLEFHIFLYKGEELTQIEIIDRIIELTDKILKEDELFWGSEEELDEIFELFRVVFPAMWW